MKNLIPFILFFLPLFFACQKENLKPTFGTPSSYVFEELEFGESKYFTFENGKQIEIDASGSFLNFESTLKNETLEEPDFWIIEKITFLNDTELQIEYNSNSILRDTTFEYFLRDQEVVIETGFSWYPEITYQLNSDFTKLSFCYESIYSHRIINTSIGEGYQITQPCESLDINERLQEIINSANEPFTDSDTIAINLSHFNFSKE